MIFDFRVPDWTVSQSNPYQKLKKNPWISDTLFSGQQNKIENILFNVISISAPKSEGSTPVVLRDVGDL